MLPTTFLDLAAEVPTVSSMRLEGEGRSVRICLHDEALYNAVRDALVIKGYGVSPNGQAVSAEMLQDVDAVITDDGGLRYYKDIKGRAGALAAQCREKALPLVFFTNYPDVTVAPSAKARAGKQQDDVLVASPLVMEPGARGEYITQWLATALRDKSQGVLLA